MTTAARTALYGAGAVATVALTLAAVHAGDALLWIALLGTPLAVAVVVRRRFLDGWVSPLLLVALALLLTAGLGAAFGRSVGDDGGVSARLALTDAETLRTALLLAVSATTLLIGGAVALTVLRHGAERSRRRAGSARARRDASRTLLPDAGFEADPATRLVVLGVSALPLLATVAVQGPDLVERSTYLIGDAGSAGGVISMLGLAGAVGCGLVLGSERGARLLLPITLAAGYLVLFFALGSRRLALLPLLMAVGAHVARPSRATRIGLVAALVAALVLLPIPLYVRGIGAHGLLPYAAALPDIVAQGDLLGGAADNLLISFPLVGATAFQVAPLPLDYFFLQVNPLPGSMIGWYDVSDSLRINLDTPFSGAGELANYGWGVLVGFWFVVGGFLGVVDHRIGVLLDAGRRGVALVLTALPLVFTILMLQYNLRSGVRMLIYAAAVLLAVRAVDALRAVSLRLPRRA
ncbi:hypothetical protein GCM10023200_51400 [Actinomycetospora chlora]|uniref:Oligosaccharide repeat unit polymerase n=1 Tax=Actinomycetospora chlora TaxID=663608 RepID=A0ABP9CG51_9PSEU